VGNRPANKGRCAREKAEGKKQAFENGERKIASLRLGTGTRAGIVGGLVPLAVKTEDHVGRGGGYVRKKIDISAPNDDEHIKKGRGTYTGGGGRAGVREAGRLHGESVTVCSVERRDRSEYQDPPTEEGFGRTPMPARQGRGGDRGGTTCHYLYRAGKERMTKLRAQEGGKRRTDRRLKRKDHSEWERS